MYAWDREDGTLNFLHQRCISAFRQSIDWGGFGRYCDANLANFPIYVSSNMGMPPKRLKERIDSMLEWGD